MTKGRSRAVTLVLAGLMFAGAAAVPVLSEPRLGPAPKIDFDVPTPAAHSHSPPADRTITHPDGPDVREDNAFAPAPAALLLSALLLALLGTGVAVLWRRMRESVKLRGWRDGDESLKERKRQQVRAALQTSLEELAGDASDPRAAVIACWLRLEQAAAAAGVHRDLADTPEDLVARMLAGQQVSRPVLDQLAGAYRQARYAPHEIGGQLRDEARWALSKAYAELSSHSREGALSGES